MILPALAGDGKRIPKLVCRAEVHPEIPCHRHPRGVSLTTAPLSTHGRYSSRWFARRKSHESPCSIAGCLDGPLLAGRTAGGAGETTAHPQRQERRLVRRENLGR